MPVDKGSYILEVFVKYHLDRKSVRNVRGLGSVKALRFPLQVVPVQGACEGARERCGPREGGKV